MRFLLLVVLVLAGFVLFRLALQDVWFRRLPNGWVAVHSLLFVGFAVTPFFDLGQLGLHVLVAVITLFVASAFFYLRWLGGGDVKLWAAVMFWAGPNLWLQALVIGTLAGGVVALFSLLAAKLTRLPGVPGQGIWRLLSADRGVPHGVGLSLAGMYVLYVYFQAVLQLHYAA